MDASYHQETIIQVKLIVLICVNKNIQIVNLLLYSNS